MLTSCCFMRLNTFGIVIGWLGIVGYIVGIVLASVGISMSREIAETIAKNMNADTDIDILTKFIVIFCSIYLVFGLIGLLSAALLVVGTVKERHLLLLPWLINSVINFVFNTISELYVVGALISGGGTAGDIAKFTIVALSAIVFQFFIIYAIYSLFKQIQANRDEQTPLVGPPGSRGNYTQI